MAGKVEIANRALIKLGADRILLLTDDIESARVLNSIYETVRDAEIRRYRWKFAIKRTSLMALVAPPPWGYTYQYPLPADYLSLIQVGDYCVPASGKFAAPYALESGSSANVILTNFQAPLKLRYVAKIENTGLYDALFVEMLACKLAMEACEPLNQSSTKSDRCASQYEFAMKEAYRQNAIEGTPDLIPDGSWLDSREWGGTFLSADANIPYPSGFSL